MNGLPLEPDHGFPVRMVIPGQIGGRMVKVCFPFLLFSRLLKRVHSGSLELKSRIKKVNTMLVIFPL